MSEIITEGYPVDDQIMLDEISCTYLQEPDCTESSDGAAQTITLSSRDGGGGKFINIKTDNWSIEPSEGLDLILKDFKHRMNDTFGS